MQPRSKAEPVSVYVARNIAEFNESAKLIAARGRTQWPMIARCLLENQIAAGEGGPVAVALFTNAARLGVAYATKRSDQAKYYYLFGRVSKLIRGLSFMTASFGSTLPPENREQCAALRLNGHIFEKDDIALLKGAYAELVAMKAKLRAHCPNHTS